MDQIDDDDLPDEGSEDEGGQLDRERADREQEEQEEREREERRMQDRRQDHETAAQVAEAAALKRAFGSDAAQRFLKLRGINDELAQEALLENYDRRQAARRALRSSRA